MLMQVIITLPFTCAALITPIYGRSRDQAMLNHSAFKLKKTDSLINTAPTPDRKSRIHFTAGYEFWTGKKSESIKTTDPPSIFDGIEETAILNWESGLYYEAAITFPNLNIKGNPVTLGIGIEKLQYQYGGFIDVDQTLSGWFSETYYGEYLVHTTDLHSFSLIGSLNLKPHAPNRVFGYSISVFSGLRYFAVQETERVTMQGHYHLNGTTGQIEYQSETFQRSMPADKLAIEAGGRLELHASRFISIILPQVTLRGTFISNAVPATTYTSGIDGDKIEIEERKSSYHGIFLMEGIRLHL